MARKSKAPPATTQYLQVTPETLRQVIGTQQPKREKREAGHMTQFYVWPLAMVLTFPALVAGALTLLLTVLWWGIRLLKQGTGQPMPWQLAVVVFVVVYCIDVLFAARRWVPFVVNQWAGPKTLAQLAGTTTVKHERSEPHVVPLNSQGGRVRRFVDKMADRVADVFGGDDTPEIDRWVQEEYDTLMHIWPDNQAFTRETFRPLVGWQRLYAKYTTRWELLGFIEPLAGNGGWRFAVGLDAVFDELPALLACSGTGEPTNDDR